MEGGASVTIKPTSLTTQAVYHNAGRTRKAPVPAEPPAPHRIAGQLSAERQAPALAALARRSPVPAQSASDVPLFVTSQECRFWLQTSDLRRVREARGFAKATEAYGTPASRGTRYLMVL